MPRAILLILTLFTCTCVPAQSSPPEEREIAAPIESVTVYLAGAQITRRHRTDLSPGRQTLVFTGITTGMDPGSIQIKADEDDVLILSVGHRIDYYEVPERSESEQSLYDRIEELEDRRRRLETEYAIVKEEEELLRANRNLTGSETGVDAEDLERGVRFYRERIADIKRSYLALSDSLRANEDARELLQRQLAELGRKQQRPATSEVIVIVEADRPTTANFELSYLVAEAGWSPSYDVRVADTDRPIDLAYRAEVYQRSGEDWTDVDLTLSTGDPTISAEAPELRTWRIRPGQRPPEYREREVERPVAEVRTVSGKVSDADGTPLIGASVRIEGTSIGTVTDIDGNYAIDLPGGAEELVVSYTGYDETYASITGEKVDIVMEEAASRLEEVVVVGYGVTNALRGRASGVRVTDGATVRQKRQERTPVPTEIMRKATTLSFAIELPYTIPSDGKERGVAIQRFTVPADYRHLAVPKRTEEVFLSAVVRDWERYDLISGEVHLFFGGTYLGDAFLDVEKTADSLVFSLGRDAGVIVSREPDTDYRKRGGLFGSKRVESLGWTISVRNAKRLPVDLTVIDQVPLSADSRIDVDTDIPDGATLNEESGEVRWRFTLPPSQEQKVSFGYQIKFPDYERIYVE
jgi:prefoldin subunit 5